ncbi:hypothetical protein CGCSCA5_v012875 [Colletotrichum siamense]|nr:hypothetical protein CGCSCA5_v012875 [Colletotrichum siamense]
MRAERDGNKWPWSGHTMSSSWTWLMRAWRGTFMGIYPSIRRCGRLSGR